MPRITQVVAPQFGETRLAGAANGVSLSTAAAFTSFPPGTQYVTLSPRNFVTGVVARYRLMPWLAVLKNQDGLATQPVDASFLLQDGDNTVALVMSSFDTLANGDALYLGCPVPFAGVHIDVQLTNSNANDMTGKYSAGGVLASLTLTDNTDTGASLAQDGTVTWTPPSDWTAVAFNELFNRNFQGAVYQDKLYWVRLDWSAALDSSVTVNQIRALGRSTAYDEIPSGQVAALSVFTGYGPLGVSGVEALTDAGTANMLVSCATLGDQKFAPAAQLAQV